MTAGLAGADLVAGFPRSQPAEAGLSDRLTSLARLIQICSARPRSDGFSAELLSDAEELLSRAGKRLQLSAAHTVVVLAGGTGSGKSSLFNRLAGADFSPVGMVRPVTREPYACVWGMKGAGPLLDWVGVAHRNAYARSSALDEGERGLTGLVLLDLPDHDSVLAEPVHGVSRLLSLADLMVWVLDPQKYADASVHRRYLVPMAGHSSVIAVVLNQSDRLSPEQAGDCVADLQRLLDAEGLHDSPIVVTSAVTGAGVEEFRKLLAETVVARRSMAERISADVDALAARFLPYAAAPSDPEAAGPEVAGAEPGVPPAQAAAGDAGAQNADAESGAAEGGTAEAGAAEGGAAEAGGGATEGGNRAALPEAGRAALTTAFSQAAGISGVCRTLRGIRELKAADYVGWPVSWLVDRAVRRDPVRKMRLGALWDELRGVTAGPADAQVAEIDNAVTVFGDSVASGLPESWAASVRDAARSRVDDIAGALGATVADQLPAENSVAAWWRLAAAWQGLLLGGVVTGLAWLVALTAVAVLHVTRHAPAAFTHAGLLPWVAVGVAGLALVGWLSALACMAAVVRAAGAESGRVEREMSTRVAEVARLMAVAPVEQELSEYERFRAELAVARGLG